MKVKIIKADNTIWYSNRIGNKYRVEESQKHKGYYEILSNLTRGYDNFVDAGSFIRIEDCIPIKEVEITSCAHPSYWYKNYIGEIYDVVPAPSNALDNPHYVVISRDSEAPNLHAIKNAISSNENPSIIAYVKENTGKCTEKCTEYDDTAIYYIDVDECIVLEDINEKERGTIMGKERFIKTVHGFTVKEAINKEELFINQINDEGTNLIVLSIEDVEALKSILVDYLDDLE